MHTVAHTLEEIPSGTPGLKVKLDRLRELVENSKRNPAFRRWVLDVVRDVPEGDWSGELAAVSRWVRKNVRYRHDPVGVELFTQPDLLASDGQAGVAAGDCDDIVALGAAMSEVLGHPSRFRVGGSRRRGEDVWSHIWRETWNKKLGRWVSYDDTAKKRPAGWSPGRHYELAGVTKAGSVDSLPTMNRCPVGVPVLDAYGCAIPGLAQMVDADDYALGDGGAFATDGSLGFVKKLGRKLDKARRKTGKKVLGKRLYRQAAKIGRQVAPIAALAVNVIPGVGQVASAALSVALANDKRIQAKKAARRFAEQEEAAFRKEEAAWNAEQDRAEAEQRMQAAIVETPMAMDRQPPRTGGTVVAVPTSELPFEEEVPVDPLMNVEEPEYPPDGAFDPAWLDDTEQATLGFFRKRLRTAGRFRRRLGRRLRGFRKNVIPGAPMDDLGFDWGSVVTQAVQAGSQYAAAGGFGRRAQRAFTRSPAAIQAAQQALSPVLTRGIVAADRYLTTPAPTPKVAARAAAGGAGAGFGGIAIAAAAAFLLMRRR